MKPRLIERSERKFAAEFDPALILDYKLTLKLVLGLTQNCGLSRPYGLHKSCLR